MDAVSLGRGQGVGRPVDVVGHRTGQRCDHGTAHLGRNPSHGFMIAGRRRREAGFDDVDLEPSELRSDRDLVVGRQTRFREPARRREASCRR